MRAALILCLALTGCGTFQLARGLDIPAGRSMTDARLDVLDCKDRARQAAGSADRQARAFLLGLTIIGTPLAYAADRADQRDAFRGCMERLGYGVKS